MIRIFHLFNSFQVGGVERLHFQLVEDLKPFFRQVCWAYHPGNLEDELKRMGIRTLCGEFELAAQYMEYNRIDCVIMRTHRYFDKFMAFFESMPVSFEIYRNTIKVSVPSKPYFISFFIISSLI